MKILIQAKSSEPPSTFSVSNSYQSVTTVDATTPVVPTTPLESPNNNTVFGNDWKEVSNIQVTYFFVAVYRPRACSGFVF